MVSTNDISNPRKLGCSTLAALGFVGLVWMLITLAGLSRAVSVGWPACMGDEGVLAMLGLSLGMLVIVVVVFTLLITVIQLRRRLPEALARLGALT